MTASRKRKTASCNSPDELWKPIKNCHGYEVSNFGRVRSYKDRGGNLRNNPHLLRCCSDGNYPLRTTLSIEGVHKIITVGREVMRAFGTPPPTPGYALKYLDGDCRNARLDNLVWAKPLRNKLTKDQVLVIRQNYNAHAEPYHKLAKHYNVSISTISDVLNYRTWANI